eukprot:TRINITY_DN148_c1_g1_i1.p1 TRINITY_DN148_c1_g1~~TRINITY_DN148_c1_g1_i1.p1  ORF type:complete len:413 (+),score=79.43 TRINITY_DN148_c1_g1_i1:227-1465(+)
MAATDLMTHASPLFAASHAKASQSPWSVEQLETFEHDPSLAADLRFILTVKNVHLPQAENLHLSRPRHSMPRIIGVTEPRAYHKGLILSVDMETIQSDSLDESSGVWSLPYTEVHGVDTFDDRYIAVSGGTAVTVYDIGTKTKVVYESPWMQHLHTLQFSKDGKRLLVASMGFDIIVEFCVETGKVTWEWCAWDHGFHESLLGHYIVRSKELADQCEGNVMYIDDPLKYSVFGVPTRYRAVGVNAARYFDGDENWISATFFHTGTAVLISRQEKRARSLLSEPLIAPHGFSEISNGDYIVSSTREGRILAANRDLEVTRELRFEGMGGIVRHADLGEWLQTSKEIRSHPSLLAALDIHRSVIWFIDWDRKKYQKLHVPRGWALQDIFIANPVWFQKHNFLDYTLKSKIELTH